MIFLSKATGLQLILQYNCPPSALIIAVFFFGKWHNHWILLGDTSPSEVASAAAESEKDVDRVLLAHSTNPLPVFNVVQLDAIHWPVQNRLQHASDTIPFILSLIVCLFKGVCWFDNSKFIWGWLDKGIMGIYLRFQISDSKRLLFDFLLNHHYSQDDQYNTIFLYSYSGAKNPVFNFFKEHFHLSVCQDLHLQCEMTWFCLPQMQTLLLFSFTHFDEDVILSSKYFCKLPLACLNLMVYLHVVTIYMLSVFRLQVCFLALFLCSWADADTVLTVLLKNWSVITQRRRRIGFISRNKM